MRVNEAAGKAELAREAFWSVPYYTINNIVNDIIILSLNHSMPLSVFFLLRLLYWRTGYISTIYTMYLHIFGTQ